MQAISVIVNVSFLQQLLFLFISVLLFIYFLS